MNCGTSYVFLHLVCSYHNFLLSFEQGFEDYPTYLGPRYQYDLASSSSQVGRSVGIPPDHKRSLPTQPYLYIYCIYIYPNVKILLCSNSKLFVFPVIMGVTNPSCDAGIQGRTLQKTLQIPCGVVVLGNQLWRVLHSMHCESVCKFGL